MKILKQKQSPVIPNPKQEKAILNIEDIKEKKTLQNAEKYVVLKNINKIYDKNVHAVVDFNLEVSKHEFVVFVGPSGCGKSTTLRMIAGLEEITSGELYINGIFSNDLTPKERDIAMVFQSYSLYPNMSVYDNLAFSLKVSHLPKDEIAKRVDEAARILEIENLLNRKPKALSGGQRQRVALGRAIVRNANVFLMDEPLSNLDAKLRVQMRSEIINLHEKINATTIYVTHDQIEAMTMADRIVVMKDGYIQPIGTPLEIYHHPANHFVASFIGSPAMNFVTGVYKKDKLTFKDGVVWALDAGMISNIRSFYEGELSKQVDLREKLIAFIEAENAVKNEKQKAKTIDAVDDRDVIKIGEHIDLIKKVLNGEEIEMILGVRPEDFVQGDTGSDGIFPAKVIQCEVLGDECYLHFIYGESECVSKIKTAALPKNGDIFNLRIVAGKTHLFDSLTGKAIH